MPLSIDRSILGDRFFIGAKVSQKDRLRTMISHISRGDRKMQNESRDIIFHPNLRYYAGPNEDFFYLQKQLPVSR